MPPMWLAHNGPASIDNAPRTVLETCLSELRESPEQVSLAIDMPSTYLRAYLERGVPRVLPSRIRRRLAVHLGVPEHAL